ncbi:MAG TPA: ROK family protein [Mycobacteriales bacterium]|nr:ROK family protein [Mycobacteriales bacterium]
MALPDGVGSAAVPASVDDVRRRNLSSLLQLLHVHGATSRADLTALTGLNRSTVKTLLEDLVLAHLVSESAPVGRGGAGRPSIQVAPAADRVYVVALDIGVEHLTALRIGLGGVVLDRRSLQQGSGDYTVRRTLTRAVRLVRTLLDGAPVQARCVGIGVGVCGVVSDDDGVVRFAPNLGWVDVPLGDMLADRLGTQMPIVLGNDGDLGARAEHLRGAGRGLTDMVYVAGEVGIGGGIIVEGRPMRGAGGYGGEIGHMVVDSRGPVCRCGRQGCWETLISDAAVLAATGAPEGSTQGDVLAAYARGEAWPRAGLRRVGRALGTGTANLVNIFNPQLIVFGGAVRHVFTATEPVVREALAGVLAAPAEQVRLVAAGLGDDSVAVGASELAFATLLSDPLGALTALPPVVLARA